MNRTFLIIALIAIFCAQCYAVNPAYFEIWAQPGMKVDTGFCDKYELCERQLSGNWVNPCTAFKRNWTWTRGRVTKKKAGKKCKQCHYYHCKKNPNQYIG